MSGIIQRASAIVRSRKLPALDSPKSFQTQREDLAAKSKAIQGKINELQDDLQIMRNKSGEWKRLIAETKVMVNDGSTYHMRYSHGQSRVNLDISDESLKLLENLITQAEGHLEINEREIATTEALLVQAKKNHEGISSVMNRLEAMDYQRSLDESLRKRYEAQSTQETIMVEKLDSDEFAREIRQLNYTTQALLELSSSSRK